MRVNIDRMSIDHIDVLSWLCLKRFQELFAEPASPRTVLPTFFGADTVFGKLDNVTFPHRVIDLPAITTDASEFDCTSLDSVTAHPNCWSALMREIDAELELSPTNSVCLKPLPQSWSPAVILMHRPASIFKTGSKRSRGSPGTLTVGIAVNHDGRAEFGPDELSDECDKCAAMFSGLDAGTKASFGEMKNVLVVCATKYSEAFAGEFGCKWYSKQRAHAGIHEVLLLDLTTPEKRTAFFGLSRKRGLAGALNELISIAEEN